MDGIQSWSTFEMQQRIDQSDNCAADPSKDSGRGIDALYVSSTSPDIAPAAVKQLKLSGLAASSSSSGNNSNNGQMGGETLQQSEEDGEFRLRFHWMRPHPSLAFASVGDEMATNGIVKDGPKDELVKSSHDDNSSKNFINPAVEASKFMEAYRYSQLSKEMNAHAQSEGSNAESEEEENSNTSLTGNGTTGTKSNNSHANDMQSINDTNKINLPFEMPKLRINLASLVEPPLMSSWLPGEDTGISYNSEDESDHDVDE